MSRTLVQGARRAMRIPWRFATVLSLVLLLATADGLVAQQTGSVTGQVTNSATGQGIAAARTKEPLSFMPFVAVLALPGFQARSAVPGRADAAWPLVILNRDTMEGHASVHLQLRRDEAQ